MLGWFRRQRKQPDPPQTSEHQDVRLGPQIAVGFANGQRSWTERVNLVELAGRVLKQRGHPVTVHGDWVQDNESGFVIRPFMDSFKPLQDGGVQTVTTIRTSHASIAPDGVVEFQHSTGRNLEESVGKGFEQWEQLDYAVLLEALRERPKQCMVLEMTFPPKDGGTARVRRAILGPVAHLRQKQPAASTPDAQPSEAEKHPFCPCCLLTNSFEAFKQLFESEGFYGIRLFAMRDENGAAGADCRVNGEECEDGKVALRKYVESWPQAGVEFRKQYVIIQNAPNRN